MVHADDGQLGIFQPRYLTIITFSLRDLIFTKEMITIS